MAVGASPKTFRPYIVMLDGGTKAGPLSGPRFLPRDLYQSAVAQNQRKPIPYIIDATPASPNAPT